MTLARFYFARTRFYFARRLLVRARRWHRMPVASDFIANLSRGPT
jgi:hypothetical protein